MRLDKLYFDIQAIDPCESLGAIGGLIRRSFADVAAQFGLTSQNCPLHPAFCDDHSLLNQLDKRGAICLAGYLEGKIVGFVALIPIKRRVYELTRLCVAPESRQAGLGGLLTDEAARLAKEHGAKKIEIGVIDAHEELKRFYAKRGFCETGTKSYAHLPFTVCGMELRI